ncbi:MAG: BatD family protein [Pirellulaceae bacterium]
MSRTKIQPTSGCGTSAYVLAVLASLCPWRHSTHGHSTWHPCLQTSGATQTWHSVAVFLALLLLVAAGGDVAAQDIQLARQRGPYYVEEPVVVQIVASQCAPGVQVGCRLQGEPPADVSVEGPQVSQSSQSFMQILNGQITRNESVDYRFSFVVIAQREGEYHIGPFEVTYGNEVKTVEGTSFQFGTLENDPDMQIACSLPQNSFYVGQEIPLTIRWSFAGELPAVQHAYAKLQVRSPLFDQFNFKEQPRTSRTALIIATAKGGMEVDAEVTQEKRDGRGYFVVTGKVIMLLDSPGKFDSIPITCRTEKVTQWGGRHLFGDPVPREVAPAMAAGTPLSFDVRPIPSAGRPPSFSGAVGRNFSLDVSANRSVVRVGDPISLTISVRGDGNIEKVSLPNLGGSDALPEDLFQLPSEEAAGTFDGRAKQFKVNVRVKDQRVTQIPPISFAWFDPSLEQFQIAQSRPIDLQVMEAHMVSAADVVSGSPGNNSTGTGTGSASGGSTAGGGAAATGPAFVGANLAIERDVPRLLKNMSTGPSSERITILLYTLSGVVLLGGIALRHRAQMDTESLRKRKRLKTVRKHLVAAGQRPPRDAADQVARSLRELVAHDNISRRGTAESIIAQCEHIIFSTGQNNTHDMQELVRQSLALVDEAAGKS